MKLSTLFPLFSLAAVACSSSTTTSTPANDAAPVDATTNDAGNTDDAGTVTVACTATVASACATAADCPYPTWADAQAAACCGGGCSLKVTSQTCGGYDVAETAGVDTTTSYYYDHGTGALTAIVRSGTSVIGGLQCGAGPASFDAPQCDRSGFACVGTAGDAGTDATGD